MVVFTCNHCGDSLQKPKVEKHYQTACRRVKSLTCVDCFKDFHGDDYNVHTKCITEEERYAAKGSIPNGIVKKGEAKQESWVDMIRSIINREQNLTPKIKNLLETIAEFNNIPRKKHKFLNFIKSSSGGRVDMKAIEDVWNIIEKYKAEMAKQDPAVNKEEKQEDNSGKRKLDDKEQEDVLKKKKKHDDENVEADESEIALEKIPKKKKKDSKAKNLVDMDNVSDGKEINGSDENKPNGADVSLDVENSENVSKKKRNKKKGNKENVDDSDTKTDTNGVNGAENIEGHDVSISKKNKKKKGCIEENGDSTKTNVENGSEDLSKTNNDTEFSFEDVITNIMNKKKTTSLKKLQKKVLNAYLKHTGQMEPTEKNIKKFNKKLHKMDTVKIELDNVMLVE